MRTNLHLTIFPLAATLALTTLIVVNAALAQAAPSDSAQAVRFSPTVVPKPDAVLAGLERSADAEISRMKDVEANPTPTGQGRFGPSESREIGLVQKKPGQCVSLSCGSHLSLVNSAFFVGSSVHFSWWYIECRCNRLPKSEPMAGSRSSSGPTRRQRANIVLATQKLGWS